MEIFLEKKFNEEKFLCDLGMQSWEYVSSLQTILTLCGKFGKIFGKILDKHAPLQSKKIKSKSSH